MGILLVVMVGLLAMAALATVYTENHGHLEARTTEYAQDKMEQLLALAYTDQVANTIVFPAAPSGGTGLAVGGSTDTGRSRQRLRRLAGTRTAICSAAARLRARRLVLSARVGSITALYARTSSSITVTTPVKSASAARCSRSRRSSRLKIVADSRNCVTKTHSNPASRSSS